MLSVADPEFGCERGYKKGIDITNYILHMGISRGHERTFVRTLCKLKKENKRFLNFFLLYDSILLALCLVLMMGFI